MVTVSLCMIVKNEEAVLARCLDSVRDLVEEILIADTGSSDRTAEIARQYTPLVFFFPWQDDFSAVPGAERVPFPGRGCGDASLSRGGG